MAKKQTRRAITLRNGVGERLEAHCAALGISQSGFVEQLAGNLDLLDADFIACAQQATIEAQDRTRRSHGIGHRGPAVTCLGRVAARYARICHCSLDDAADAIGVDVETVRRWWVKLYRGVPTSLKRRRRLRVNRTMAVEVPILNRRARGGARRADPPIPFWLLPTGPVRREQPRRRRSR